ncbi:hypothetical protein PAXINDRAFT_17712 [Paxillus involutus ATCC 200175]|uniref:Uncharacterized protein n=1 Tax=Paxillus involutus ATCC 200175 TaxID=664439 RepID=A0A0C9T0M1_PAXIN|nr:hypothetical protein PAXINDRAFT_17712 [Paxillus involutus ATCC 200175]
MQVTFLWSRREWSVGKALCVPTTYIHHIIPLTIFDTFAENGVVDVRDFPPDMTRETSNTALFQTCEALLYILVGELHIALLGFSFLRLHLRSPRGSRRYFLGGVRAKLTALSLNLFAFPLTFAAQAYIAAFTFILQSFLPSVTYGEAPLAIIPGCYKTGISTIVFASFVVIMLAEAVTVTLTLYRAYHYFRHTPNALVQNMTRDGAFYCVTMFCMSVANVLVIFLVPLQYVDMITVYQAVMHTILTIRMQLHLRKVNEHTYLGDRFAEGSLVPMSFMRSAFLADT